MFHRKIGATLLATLILAAVVWATESDELREQAQDVRREAAKLAERGHKEEAEQLERRAIEMLEEAERLEAEHQQRERPDAHRAERRELQERLEHLRREEAELREVAGAGDRLHAVREEAEHIERMLHPQARHVEHEPSGPRREAMERMEHMRAAVEHLKHAGLHDVARHVAERAEAMERELHAQHRRPEHEPLHEVMRQLDELRHEVGRLRDQVNELRERR